MNGSIAYLMKRLTCRDRKSETSVQPPATFSMRLPALPPAALVASARLHGIQLNGTSIERISPEIGLGVLFRREKYNPTKPALLTVGKDLILSADNVEIAGKSDPWVKDLLRACCGILGADQSEVNENEGEPSDVGVPDLNFGEEQEVETQVLQPWGRNPRLMIMLFLTVMMVRAAVNIEEKEARTGQRTIHIGVGTGGIWSE